ncbi:MAG TPA: hypothetical protein PKB06_09985, partial [Actinotalea sp.]|nr:hypothetical protein [Actinotalea sp.]
MIRRAVLSELFRLRRPRLLAGWFGLTALFTLLINSVVFTIGESLPPGAGPGVTFPDAATLAGPDGLVAGLAAASSMFGVITLSFWALASATDHTSGMIRLLAAAQPRRWVLLAGKVGALVLVTAVATTVAVVVNVGVAPVAAEASGLDVSAWRSDTTASVILGAWGTAFLAQMVWGAIGLALATVTRSAAPAISTGVGWVLVVESVVSRLLDGEVRWLPGTVLTA